MAPRVRFAPSPTGYLHVGGARTALFNWLFAKKTGGAFILRIEDTDKERSTESHTQVILDGLKWLGIGWDEGPYFQGGYGDRHRADAERLVAAGRAYRCFCTKEELDAARAVAEKTSAGFRYDGRCGRLTGPEVEARLGKGTPFSIRLRMPDEEIAWDDAVHDRISFQGRDLDDFILLRSDGSPIYNLAVVSDDVEMRISHVIRGDDHISNTPKQIAIYRALGATPPVFAHVPMILGADGKKLSKRHGAVSVDEFRNAGYLPEALVNFLALIGWAPDGETTIMSRDEIVERFTLEAVSASPGTFDFAKLDWMNGVYLRALSIDAYATELTTWLREHDIDWPADRIEAAAPLVQEKIGRLAEFPEFAGFLFHDVSPDRSELDEAVLSEAADVLEAVEPWTAESIEAALKNLCETRGEKPKTVFAPIRIAVTGSRISPGLYESLELLGSEDSLRRLRGVPRPG
jgi:glutamyl-tRNA synthetase